MSNNALDSKSSKEVPRHLRIVRPSPWVERWTHLIRPGGAVLDLAAGGGRHGRMFLARGHRVVFVDRTIEPLADLADTNDAEVIAADLEDGSPWPLGERTFDAVIVVNYLHRELFPLILSALASGGVLIYETFARGNEDYARPRNPDHLLKSGELLEMVSGKLQVVGYEHGLVEGGDITGVKQRLCAVNDFSLSQRNDGDPPAHSISRV